MQAIMLKTTLAVALTMALALPAHAERKANGALIGAGIGILSGNGVKGAIKGAVLGGGIAAATDNGRKGYKAREGAKKGVVLGAGIGLLTSGSVEGAVKGAVAGAAGGAILGHSSSKRW